MKMHIDDVITGYLIAVILKDKVSEKKFRDMILQEYSREERHSRKTAVLKRAGWSSQLFDNDDYKFRTNVRMSKKTFGKLLKMIEPQLTPTEMKNPRRRIVMLSAEAQLAIFLQCLGCNAKNREIATQHDITIGAVPEVFNRVLMVLLEIIVPKEVFWPTGEKAAQIKTGFEILTGIPGIVGVIDGTYVRFRSKPAVEDPGDYYSIYAGGSSINVMAICDHEGYFTSFDIGFPGGAHDGFIWSRSSVFEQRASLFENDDFLVGDSSYPISEVLIGPYTREKNGADISDNQKAFNIALSKAYVPIQEAFGYLKALFPCLKRLPATDMPVASQTIAACMALYNFMKSKGDIDWVTPEQEKTFYRPFPDDDSPVVAAGKAKRDRLANAL